MREQHHSQIVVVLVGGDLVGISGWVGGVGGVGWVDIASATAAAQYPFDWPEDDSIEAAAGTFAHKAVESGVGHAVQGSQQ